MIICHACKKQVDVSVGHVYVQGRITCIACYRAKQALETPPDFDPEPVIESVTKAMGGSRENLRVVYGEGVPEATRTAFEKAGVKEWKPPETMEEAFEARHAATEGGQTNDYLETINCLRQERDEAQRCVRQLEIRLKGADMTNASLGRSYASWRTSADRLGKLAARYENERDDAHRDLQRIRQAFGDLLRRECATEDMDDETHEAESVEWVNALIAKLRVPYRAHATYGVHLTEGRVEVSPEVRKHYGDDLINAMNRFPFNPSAVKFAMGGAVPKGYPALDESGKSCLDLARECVDDRAGQYGNPLDNHGITAEFWTTRLRARGLLKEGAALTPEDVCYMNASQKESRDIFKPKLDNQVDGCGYLRNVEVIRAIRKQREGGGK
jgi:hypothetical protein